MVRGLGRGPQRQKDNAQKAHQGTRLSGRTPQRGVFLPSEYLLDALFSEPLLRTLLRTVFPSENLLQDTF